MALTASSQEALSQDELSNALSLACSFSSTRFTVYCSHCRALRVSLRRVLPSCVLIHFLGFSSLSQRIFAGTLAVVVGSCQITH